MVEHNQNVCFLCVWKVELSIEEATFGRRKEKYLHYVQTRLNTLPTAEHEAKEFPVLTPKKLPGQTVQTGRPHSQPLILIPFDSSFCIRRSPSCCAHCARSEALEAARGRPLTFISTSVHLGRAAFEEIMIAATLLCQDSDLVELQREEKVRMGLKKMVVFVCLCIFIYK